MLERSAFLQAIIASPDEDAPRLLYADWLEEQGEAERAEFIRAQCELAQLTQDGSESQALYSFLQENDRNALEQFDWQPVDAGVARRILLQERIEALEKGHKKVWRSEYPPRCGLFWSDYRRGFCAGGTLRSGKKLASCAETVLRETPLSLLEVRDLTTDHAIALLDAGIIRRLTALRLYGSIAGLDFLAQSPDVGSIRELTCGYGYGESRGILVETLASSPHWSGLRSLDLRDSHFPPAAVVALFQARHLRNLIDLRLWSERLTSQHIRTLAEGGFKELRALQLFQGYLDDECAEILANAPHLKQLRTLDLATSRISGAGASALIASRHLKNLVALSLFQNPVRGLDAAALAKTSGSSLRALHLENGRLTRADITTLVNCPALRSLVWLNLESNNLNDKAVIELTKGSGFERLAVLGLLYNRFTDKGAKALAEWQGLEHLRCLHLNGNDIGPEGAQALAGTPHLTNVRHLCISKESVKPAGVKALQRRFGEAAKVF